MAATNNITIDILLAEQKRIREHMLKSYPDMVRNERITPYDRDHRLNCNEKIIELLNSLKQFT